MSSNFKQTIAVVLTAIILFIAWYGSYLPMRKAEIYISTLQDLQSQPPASINELETRLEPSLEYMSPIGQEELVRNMANSTLGFVQRSQDATSTAMLLSFLDKYYAPIIARGKGMSFGQDLYLNGAINEIAFVRTQNPQYIVASQSYYEKARMLGPNRPQPLYGLFDIYRFEGDATDTIAVGEKILSLWPTDQSVSNGLAEFKAQMLLVPKAPFKK
jgi:hypothetical protein